MLKKTFEMPDGKIADYDILKNNDFVSIAAFTKKREAILVRQYRPGPEKEMISFPEGYIDQDETSEVAAKRELLEETGYQSNNVQYLRQINEAYSTENKFCLVATDCELITEQELDENEHIEVFLMPLEEFRKYITDSSVDNFRNIATAYMALDRLKWL